MIVARYEDRPDKRGKRLKRVRVVGDFEEDSLDEFYGFRTPYTFSYDSGKGIGKISWRVEKEEEAREMIENLNSSLDSLDVVYRGKVAVPEGELEELSSDEDKVYKLVSETLIREAKGEKIDDLEEVDFDRLT